MTEKIWFKDGLFWRHQLSTDYGDLIHNTQSRNYELKLDDWWVYRSLEESARLLNENKRWPDRFNEPEDYKYRLAWLFMDFIRDALKIVGIHINIKERAQNDMTRDPYIALYNEAVYLGRVDIIESTPMNWYLWRPSVWAWRKYLITKDKRCLRRYRFWDRFTSSKKPYVINLRRLMEEAINNLTVKLYKVPDRTWVRVWDNVMAPIGSPAINKGDILFFHHLDGMYSLCSKDESHVPGNSIYLSATTDVEIIKFSQHGKRT